MSNRRSVGARQAVRSARADQKAATRSRLLRVAERQFARHGFDATSVGQVCREAGVTHGALYHRFESKTGLFTAVLQALTARVANTVRSRAAAASGWRQVEVACDAYLEACTSPSVQAIIVRDGPRVLPHATFQAIDHEVNEPLVTALLRAWIAAGLVRRLNVELVARVLGGAFAEAGAAIAASPARAATRAELSVLLRDWLSTLKPTTRTRGA